MKLSTSSYQCWKCGNFCLMEHKFCSTCNTIQPTRDELSYFEVLGVEPQFNINVDHLSNQFKNLQRLYHPDKFSGASEREQELSAQHSSRINKAYQTLSQPLPRAEYLLLLSEQVLTEADTDLDKRFLITVMDLNEELAEAETETQLAELKQRVQLTYDQLIRDAGEAFNTSAAAARPLVAQAKYYRSLLDKIRQQERERGIAD
ncbi:Co-chaperone Hsc20 [Trinorchestia longiramus]|nr:Co-chaperone Hsc20 [Trinorchestia longiramus]